MASSYRASHSHSDTLHSVGLRTSGQPDTETSTRQHTTLTRDKHPCPSEGFEPAFSTRERPQTYALDCAATKINPRIFDHYLNYTVEPEMAQSTVVMSVGIIRIS